MSHSCLCVQFWTVYDKKTFALAAAFVHKNTLFPGFSCVFFTCHVTSPVMFSFLPLLVPSPFKLSPFMWSLSSISPSFLFPPLSPPPPSCNFPYFSSSLFCQPSLLCMIPLSLLPHLILFIVIFSTSSLCECPPFHFPESDTCSPPCPPLFCSAWYNIFCPTFPRIRLIFFHFGDRQWEVKHENCKDFHKYRKKKSEFFLYFFWLDFLPWVIYKECNHNGKKINIYLKTVIFTYSIRKAEKLWNFNNFFNIIFLSSHVLFSKIRSLFHRS